MVQQRSACLSVYRNRPPWWWCHDDDQLFICLLSNLLSNNYSAITTYCVLLYSTTWSNDLLISQFSHLRTVHSTLKMEKKFNNKCPQKAKVNVFLKNFLHFADPFWITSFEKISNNIDFGIFKKAIMILLTVLQLIWAYLVVTKIKTFSTKLALNLL